MTSSNAFGDLQKFYTFLCEHQEVCRKKIKKITIRCCMEIMCALIFKFTHTCGTTNVGLSGMAFRHWGYLPEKSIFCVKKLQP